jgi:hypothetical protein|tara:strand:+ start:420 stop:599 length:180 start_codon:yes stop_codon:yes gene_type:complete
VTKKRTLVSGKEVPDLGRVVNLSILTKCPEKWKIVDMETGQEYVASGTLELYKQWKRIK